MMKLARVLFWIVVCVSLLANAVVLGMATAAQWRWDHKNLLAVLGWLVLAGLLTGRQVFGWRGRRATRWLYFGALLLLSGLTAFLIPITRVGQGTPWNDAANAVGWAIAEWMTQKKASALA